MSQPTGLVYVRFQCADPATDLMVLLGADRPDVSSGYGGWSEVERPKRTTVTTWAGQPARRFALAILIDRFDAGVSVEGDIRALELMALPRPGGEPPTVRVSAPGGIVPPYLEKMDWVIDALAWGDAAMNTYGNRTRQAATVTLLQYVSDDLVAASPAKKRRAGAARKSGKNKKKGAKTKRKASHAGRPKAKPKAFGATIVFDGEDLLSVAARELGDATRWHEIAELNGIRDPRAVTRAQVIRLP